MLDPEAFVIRGGMLTLALIGMARLVWRELNNFRNDIRRNGRRARRPLR